MDNIKNYIKTLFHQDTDILLSSQSNNDVKIHVSKGKDECYKIVRETLMNNINGSCIYGIDDDIIYFTLSKNDIMVFEKIAKAIKKKNSIIIDTVVINPYKFSFSMNSKKKAFWKF